MLVRTVHFPEVDETACLGLLRDLVRIKSYSQSDGERQAVQFIADQMTALGLDAGVFPFANGTRQNAIGRWRGSDPPRSRSLLFNGHLDTNPVTEGWTVDPWEGKIDDHFIYGIGVSNMKAGCAAYYCAVKTLKDSGWQPKGDVTLTFVVGELQGGVGTVAAIDQGRMAADYFINCEPSDLRAITMHAASLVFEIDLVGVTRHMSAREEAVDAILAACAVVPALTALTFSGARSELHEKVNRCHVGVVHGALGRQLQEWRSPQVSDFCQLRGSARYAPGQTEKGVLDDIRSALHRLVRDQLPGLSFEVRKVDEPTMPAFEVSPDSSLVKSLNRAYKDVRGEPQQTGVIPPTCFYGSDAGHLYQSLGMEGIVCGPGGKYNTRPDEKVDIADFLDCVRIFMRTIVDICG